MNQRLHALDAELADKCLRVGIGAIQGGDDGRRLGVRGRRAHQTCKK